MTNFNEYLDEEHAARQLKIIDKIELSDSIIDIIKDKKANLTVFAQIYCPDCQAIVAILENLSKNCGGLDIKYIPRTGNEELLKSFSKEARIPTIIKDSKVLISEFPDYVKSLMQYMDKEEVKVNFRLGKYNKEIIDELVYKIFMD